MTKQEQYAAAVAVLVEMAQTSTGGGRVAAQVILSCYNGYDYQLDIPDLCYLEKPYFEVAMMVIRGRCELMKEPHSVIPDGNRIFQALWKQWHHLHVEERGKIECPRCHGVGAKFANEDDEDGTPCTYCGGKGRVCRCKV